MLNEAICSVCGAVQAGGSGPGLNFVFTLETGTETTGAWSSDRSRGHQLPGHQETVESVEVPRCEEMWLCWSWSQQK